MKGLSNKHNYFSLHRHFNCFLRNVFYSFQNLGIALQMFLLKSRSQKIFLIPKFVMDMINWRLRWKKGARFVTQNWTLSKTLQISHAVLFRCVKKCSVCFFAEAFFVYEILRMQKSLYLWSHKHMTGKTVISLKIQQNIVFGPRVIQFRE